MGSTARSTIGGGEGRFGTIRSLGASSGSGATAAGGGTIPDREDASVVEKLGMNGWADEDILES